MRARVVYIVLVVIVLLGLFSATWSSGVKKGMDLANKPKKHKTKEGKESTSEQIIKTVQVNHVHGDTIMARIEGNGRVVSGRSIKVSSEAQGELLQGNVTLKKGITFRKGATLFRVDQRQAKLALKARKSSYMNIIATALPDLKLDFPTNFNAWRDFFDRIQVGQPLPSMPNIKAQSKSQATKLKTFLAAKGILSEYYNILSDEDRIAKSTVTAPFAGSILEVSNNIGTIVNPGSPILTIIKSGSLEVEIALASGAAKHVKVGQMVDLSHNGNSYTAKVARISKYINKSTQSQTIFASIIAHNKADAQQLLDGMYLTARFAPIELINVGTISRQAIFGDQNIYIANKDNILESRKIKVVLTKGDKVIFEGFEYPTAVVIEPLLDAYPGMKVRPQSNKK